MQVLFREVAIPIELDGQAGGALEAQLPDVLRA